jgi:hypothetical protein
VVKKRTVKMRAAQVVIGDGILSRLADTIVPLYVRSDSSGGVLPSINCRLGFDVTCTMAV